MARSDEQAHAHEIGLIRAFIVPHRQERFLTLLASPKGRIRFVAQLAHFQVLDPRYALRSAPSDRTVNAIYRLLRGRDAPHACYVMGERRDLDGREVALREALESIVPLSFGNFLSCIPGTLGFFGGEEPGDRYILERRSAHRDRLHGSTTQT